VFSAVALDYAGHVSEDSQAAEIELTAQRVVELVDSGEAMLIDVRVEYEWEAGRIGGSRRIEINELTARADSIAKDRPIVFVCRSGNRSGFAAQAFREAGWDAYNLAGGLIAWVEAGLALEPEGGSVAEGLPPSA